jgi:hypothetical protein
LKAANEFVSQFGGRGMERLGRFFGAPGRSRPRRSRRVLDASGRNSVRQIIPGEVAGEKGSPEVPEGGGAAGNHGKY